MTKYVIRRFLQALPTLVGITIIAFAIMSLAPGGPTTALGFNPDLTPRQRAAMAEAIGVDDPWPVQYLRWLFGDAAYIAGGERAWRVDIGTDTPDGKYYIFSAGSACAPDEASETVNMDECLLESGSIVSVADVELPPDFVGTNAAEAPGDLPVDFDDLPELTPELQRGAALEQAYYIPNLPITAWRVSLDDEYYIFDATTGGLLTRGNLDEIPEALLGTDPAEAPRTRQDFEDIPDLLADNNLISAEVADDYDDLVREYEAALRADPEADVEHPLTPFVSAGFLAAYETPAWRLMTDVDNYLIVSAITREVFARGSAIRVTTDVLDAPRMGYAASHSPDNLPVQSDDLGDLLTQLLESNPRIDDFWYLPSYGGTTIWGGRLMPIFDTQANPIGEKLGDRWGILRGDFGVSVLSQRPAMEVIFERLPATIELGLASLFLGLTIGIVVGVIAAVYQGSWFDQVTRVGAVVVSSIPVYWLGLILLLLFGSQLGWLPMGGRLPNTISGEYTLWDRLSRLILPVFTLSSFSIATFSRYMRASLLDVLGQDYIRTAHAKGVKPRTVWFQHGMRNALIPIATILGPSLTLVITGAVLTETIYSWPGMGRLLVNAVQQTDYSIIMGIVILVSIATILGYLISDILYALFDPRIRLD
jgi:peptide/nickel transport system permease protein